MTHLGDAWAIGLFLAGATYLLIKRKWYYRALLLLVSMAGATAINLSLKAFFARQRPELWDRLITETSFSFPSGHAMASSALAFSLVAVLWQTRWRIKAAAIAGIYTVLIGYSRLYLGVHYPSDVLAGWMVSLAWVLIISALLSSRYLRRKYRAVDTGTN